MSLVNLELGKWIYLAIYLFIPLITLLILIRSLGLTSDEKPVEKAERHIGQADYWANIALNSVQSEIGTKSLESLLFTIQRNLEEAAQLLETAVPHNERPPLLNQFKAVENKYKRLKKQQKSVPASSPSLPL
jgi:hypothetical protein